MEAKLKFERDSSVVQASLDGKKKRQRMSERSYPRRKSVGSSYDTCVSAFSGEGSFSNESDEKRREKYHTEKDYWANTRQKISTVINSVVVVVGFLVVIVVVLTTLLAGFFRNFPWLVAQFLSFVGAIARICETESFGENKTCPPPPACVEGGGYRY